MKAAILPFALLGALFTLSACSPQEKVETSADQAAADSFPLVPKENRAASFEAVAHDLDLGGSMFYFADLGTTVKDFGANLQKMAGGMAAQQPMNMGMAIAANAPVEELFDTLGISDLSAIGMSTYHDGSLYHNKSVVYLPNGAHGIFALMGTQAHAFDSLALAPEDTDIFLSQDFHGSVIKQVIQDGAEALMPGNGDQMAAGILNKPIPGGSALTIGEALDKADTELAVVVRLGETQEISLPESDGATISYPKPDFLVRLKGMSWLINDGVVPFEMFVSEGKMKRTEKDGLVIYQDSHKDPENTPQVFLDMVIALDTANGNLIVASNEAFFDECRSGKTSLGDSPRYQAALKGLPAEGNCILYASKKSFQAFIDLRKQLETQIPEVAGAFGIYQLYLPLLGLDKVEADAASITQVRANSIFSDSRWPTGIGLGNTIGGSSTTLVTTGLLAAMAIPAFNKVRTTSREKAITNNLRQVAAAGMQYILENGVAEARYEQLEGEYFSPIQPVAGESYEDLVVSEAGGTLEVTTASGDTVSYEYEGIGN